MEALIGKTFSKGHRLGYFEVGGNLEMTPAALLVHLQDTAILHSENLGYTLGFMAEAKRCWALLNWHVVIESMPRCFEELQITTWASRCRRMQAERSFVVFDQTGKEAIKVASRWAFLDMENRCPTSLIEGMAEKYGDGGSPALPNERFLVPAFLESDRIFTREFAVTRRDTDNNGHVNNVKYIEWAMDDVGDDIYNTCRLADIKVVYRKECFRGTEVLAKTAVREVAEGYEILTAFSSGEQLYCQICCIWKKR